MSFRTALSRHFDEQASFSQGYAPLYSRLFSTVAGWLAADSDQVSVGRAVDDRQVADWLVEAAAGRAPFEVTLLLAAALHRDVLAREPAVASLAAYYPTVGGRPPADDDADFDAHLQAAILARRSLLSHFIQMRNVQTNETGRGLAWLLPLYAVPWSGVHLLDLGASAGLNLVADQRSYRLFDPDGRPMGDVGFGRPVEFQVTCRRLAALPVAPDGPPAILSRDGVDQAPFELDDTEAELTLQSFVWGDQPERLARLREGIGALRRVAETTVPVQLHAVQLPDELAPFLNRHAAHLQAPIVLYNTYITPYLPGKTAALRAAVAGWAAQQPGPVLWLQWESPPDGLEPPAYSWCAWTADLWHANAHRQWHLGWAHPHAVEVQFLAGWTDWIDFWAGTGEK